MSSAHTTKPLMRRTLFLACLCGLIGCDSFTNLISTEAGSEDGGRLDAAMEAGPAEAGPSDAAPPVTISDAGIVLCGTSPCACSNGLDDDGDGLVDGFDGECTGPYDQDEATFRTGEIKEGNPRCSDCFFDGNPSPNDDDCRLAASCGVNGTASGGNPSCDSCEPSAQCVDSCLPRTPNGCDCFGCCEVQRGATTLRIQITDSCSLKTLDDPAKCPRCVLASACQNPCGRCELCPGRTLADLPSDCATAGGPGYSCDGADVCGPSQPCSGLSYCSQGCCLPIVL